MSNRVLEAVWSHEVTHANFRNVQLEWIPDKSGVRVQTAYRSRFTVNSTDITIARDLWPDVQAVFPGVSHQQASKAFYNGSKVGLAAFRDTFNMYGFMMEPTSSLTINWMVCHTHLVPGQITVFTLTYVDDNWFTLSTDGGYLRVGSANGYGALYLVDSVEQFPDGRLFGFLFSGEGKINGITGKRDPDQYLKRGVNAVLQPYTISKWDSSCAILLTFTRSPAHQSFVDGTFDLSKCCTAAAYGADPAKQQLCIARGLSMSSIACAAFMADPTAGYCKANYTSANCIEYCNDGETNCDAVYQAACNPATNPTAVADPNGVCGCFLPASTYDAIRQKIEAQIPGYVTSQPACFYPKCASSKLRTKQRKTTQCDPTQIVACFTEITVENNGVVSGDINIKQTPECGFKGSSTSSSTATTDTPSSGTFDSIMALIQENIIIVGAVAAFIVVIVVISLLTSSSSTQKRKRRR